MLDKFIHNGNFLPAKIYVVEGRISPTNEMEYFALELHKKGKSKISFQEVHRAKLNEEELFETLKKAIPVVLCIEGKGILSRAFEQVEDPDQDWVKKLIPGAHEEDFYPYQIEEDQTVYFSLARRDKIDEILGRWTNFGFRVIDVHLGNLVLTKAILKAFNLDLKPKLEGGFNTFLVEESIKIAELDEGSAGQQYDIGKEKLRSQFLVPFVLGTRYWVESQSEDIPDEIKENSLQEKYKVAFENVGKLGVALVFFILVFNYLIYSRMADKYEIISVEYASTLKEMDRTKELKKEWDKTIVLLNQIGLLNGTKTSFYADRVAETLPNRRSLTNMVLYPLQDKLKDGEEVHFDKGSIVIEGEMQSSQDMNAWINSLQRFEWVDKVELDAFQKADKKATNIFHLTLYLS